MHPLLLALSLTHAAPPAPLAECEVVNRDATSALLICRNWMASAAHLNYYSRKSARQAWILRVVVHAP